MKNFVFLALLVLLGACGKEIVYINQEGKPVTPGECLPKAVADAGGEQHIAYSDDPSVILPLPDRAPIGTPELPGLSYRWEPAEGLSDPNVAQPIASPKKSTIYSVTVINPKCGPPAKSSTTVWVLEEKMSADKMGVTIDGKWYPTGYSDLYQFIDHYRASYLHMGTGYYAALKAVQDVIDLTPTGFHVNRQPRGSCWAEGGRSCGEATYNYVFKQHVHISTQRIIDCSGFGSAAGGGQISVDDFVRFGLVREVDYPYDGYDHKCKKDVQPFFKAKSTFILRDKNGNRPKMEDLLQAHIAFGASEDCGSAGALGSGGYKRRPGGGSTNHCWGGFGIKKHPSEGWYCRLIQNSWGDDWGGGEDLSGGQGCYGFNDDGTMSNGILAENKFVDMGSPCPPPRADAGPDKTILQVPGLPDFAVVGVKPTPTQLIENSYEWSIVSGDMSAEIDNVNMAVTLVKPKKTTRLRLTVKNKCAVAHAEVTIHVWVKDPVTGSYRLAL